jgi:hypothetical protein
MTTQETRRSLRREWSIMAGEGDIGGVDTQASAADAWTAREAASMLHGTLVDDGVRAHLLENQRLMGRFATIQR